MTTAMVNRKGLRFPAETGTLVQIGLDPAATDFTPDIVGLVLDEAARGCGAVILKHGGIKEGATCSIKVGRLSPVRAEIKWVKELDTQVMKIGFLYCTEQGCT